MGPWVGRKSHLPVYSINKTCHKLSGRGRGGPGDVYPFHKPGCGLTPVLPNCCSCIKISHSQLLLLFQCFHWSLILLFWVLFPSPLQWANSVIFVLALTYSQKQVTKFCSLEGNNCNLCHLRIPYTASTWLRRNVLSCYLILSLAEPVNTCYSGTQEQLQVLI